MTARSVLRDLFHRCQPQVDEPGPGFRRLPGGHRPHLVDAHTRTFWSPGSGSPATLVETGGEGLPPRTGRAATLVADHERGVSAGGRPRANPAFSEAVFVELMRARQYHRAYALLSPECQQSWGSVQPFIDAQRIAALARLGGVRVLATRPLTGWRDPDSGMVHDHATELDVEYTVGDGRNQVAVPRTVHLVAHGGTWRSLCYPTASTR